MTRSTDLLDLLAQDAWARRLARSLARGPEDAEDLVQEAYARALAPGATPIAHARGWLARVLRNVHIKRRHADSARAQRERAHARARATFSVGTSSRDAVDEPRAVEPSPDELAARAEVQERLAAAVLELEPRQRDVVLLRHFDDASIAAIARRLGLAPATVHEHLERGHAELRRKLAHWATDTRISGGFALLLFGRDAASATAVTLGGGAAAVLPTSQLLLVMTMSKLSIGVALAAALSFILWLTFHNAPGEADSDTDSGAALAGAPETTDSATAAGRALGQYEDARIVRDLAEGSSVSRKEVMSATAAEAVIWGKVQPAEDVSLHCSGGISGTDRTVPAADGSYRIAVEAPGSYWLSALRVGWRRAEHYVEVQPGIEYQLDLTLAPISRVEIELHGLPDHVAVPKNTRVEALADSPTPGTVLRAVTGSPGNPYGLGRFRPLVERSPPGAGICRLGALEIDYSGSVSVALCFGATVAAVKTIRVPEDERVIFQWQEVELRATAGDIVINLPSGATDARATVVGQGGEVEAKSFSGRVKLTGLSQGRYIVRIESADLGPSLEQVSLGAEDVVIEPRLVVPHTVQLRCVNRLDQQPLVLDGSNNGLDAHFLELCPFEGATPPLGGMTTKVMPLWYQMPDQVLILRLSPGMYRLRLCGKEWASEFATVDVRDGDTEIILPCSRWIPVSIAPEPSWNWRGEVLTVRDAEGCVLHEQQIFRHGPVTLDLVPGWNEVTVVNGANRILARQVVHPEPESKFVRLARIR
jgi:RNA polymerase sigma factor (sigma-70 family)